MEAGIFKLRPFGEVLAAIDDLPETHWLYLPNDDEWTLESDCLVLESEEVPPGLEDCPDAGIPAFAKDCKLMQALTVGNIQDIVNNVREQKHDASVELIFDAFIYYYEMSTTDEAEVKRLGALVSAKGAEPIDCPVSGGCHRAATGNISILAGCERATFDRALPAIKAMGRRILHAGPLGSASILKVVTNYLATANLVSLCEALVTARMAGMDLNTTYEAIKISSGSSFVHETESQVILNGSRDISFTMDLVVKDMSLFTAVAERASVPLEVAPVLLDIFKDGEHRYGSREWSPNIIKRLEEACGVDILAPGFPAEMIDDEPEVEGW